MSAFGFKRDDYTPKEIAEMPFYVHRFYMEYVNGISCSYTNILEECKYKYPEYFL